jgi:SNF family Na+-dependent transporter
LNTTIQYRFEGLDGSCWSNFLYFIGMGTIHCYAAYIDAKDDIALNAVSTGFMNEFVEVVLGSLILFPIAAGYLGLDWVIQNAGFGMAFQTMPYLFEQWGSTCCCCRCVLDYCFLLYFFISYGNTLDGIHERRVWLV